MSKKVKPEDGVEPAADEHLEEETAPAEVVTEAPNPRKQAVRDALAAQPFRDTPSFEDLLAVADAIIDSQ